MEIKIINKSSNPLPFYATEQAAGMDLYVWTAHPITLQPLGRTLVKTGLYMEIPKGYEAQVRPRSGLALKKGITLLNAPGTIDADYRGEIGILVVNLSNEAVTLKNGERIAQMVIAKHEIIKWKEVKILEESSRGSGGFGSTGVKDKYT
ncbi:deoxyuridine 5'-triphosphate nucleotidohydrolase [Elysia marginata]|uniref:Deoxyuridine 5'-triphosphate nucleotidohydrolase n=1 Tax=Elysia marginata TaxID=1093978 RepID=A0AAV4FMJ5_9GAST|nr:deoxyuridine 5'-triphosphate nucleotidohydrolase [Elysia marginata]